jgi:hypothetical protein
MEELEHHYFTEQYRLETELKAAKAKQNRERGVVVLDDDVEVKCIIYNSCYKLQHMFCPGEIFLELERCNKAHNMTTLSEDNLTPRKLVRIDEECGDDYEVYVFEYRRRFKYDEFRKAHPEYTGDEPENSIYARHFLEKVEKPTEYKFVTMDGGLTFELIQYGALHPKYLVH